MSASKPFNNLTIWNGANRQTVSVVHQRGDVDLGGGREIRESFLFRLSVHVKPLEGRAISVKTFIVRLDDGGDFQDDFLGWLRRVPL
jgi:hypothetical protein